MYVYLFGHWTSRLVKLRRWHQTPSLSVGLGLFVVSACGGQGYDVLSLECRSGVDDTVSSPNRSGSFRHRKLIVFVNPMFRGST